MRLNSETEWRRKYKVPTDNFLLFEDSSFLSFLFLYNFSYDIIFILKVQLIQKNTREVRNAKLIMFLKGKFYFLTPANITITVWTVDQLYKYFI